MVPVFNVGGFVEASVRSVLDQRYQNFEVLVVDDGSTDDTVERVARMARRDARVRLIELGSNSGLPAVSRNRGVREAKGELIAFLDGDDLWAKRKLRDQVSVMVDQPNLVLVYSMFVAFGCVPVIGPEWGIKPLPFRASLTRAALESENTIPCSSVLARTEAIRTAGAFDEDPKMVAAEDYDLWLRLAQDGPIGFVPRMHGYYRVHVGAISRNYDVVDKRREYLFAKRGISANGAARPARGPLGAWVRAGVHTTMIAWALATGWLPPALSRARAVTADVR